MKKIMLWGLGIMIVAGAFFINSQPNEFKISRSMVMAAPAVKIFSEVNDFHRWQAWSPWARLDPQAKNSFEGANYGLGARFRWSGNNQVGEGVQTIVDVKPPDYLKIELEFIKPMKAKNIAEFSFQENMGQTTVTWSMSGKNNFIGKAMSFIMNCDQMVGEQFEQGLKNLKAVVEKP